MQFEVETQVTPWRKAPTTPGPERAGVGTTDHAEPSHCSISAPVGLPPLLAPSSAPTAQHSRALAQDAPNRPPPLIPAGSGAPLPRDQLAPFQVSTIGDGVELGPLMSARLTPAAKHWTELAQVVPSRMSSF